MDKRKGNSQKGGLLMKKVDFELPIFNWSISVVTLLDASDKEGLTDLLVEMGADLPEIRTEVGWLEKGMMNGGDTWHDFDVRKILLIIFPWTDEIQFHAVLAHEKRHIVDRICEHHRIKDIETPAYIDGYLTKYIYTHLNELK